MALYRGYGDGIVLHGADALVVHPCRDRRVVMLEYEVYGRVVASDAIYENRFVSIVTIENGKVVLWRDYMESLAVMRALSWAAILSLWRDDPDDPIRALDNP